MQKCLGRNTATIEAHAPRIHLRIDQGHVHPEIGGEESSGVPSGTSAHDSNVERWRVRHVDEKVSTFQGHAVRSTTHLSQHLRCLHNPWILRSAQDDNSDKKLAGDFETLKLPSSLHR